MIYGEPEAAPILSGLLAVTLCTLGFVSVGLAVSSFTENQVVAGISSMVALLLLYVIHSPAEAIGGVGAAILNGISPVMQARDMMRGVVTLSSLVYFLSLIGFGLFLSERALEAHRWR
jgi:ABC-2 type transport system permease protein